METQNLMKKAIEFHGHSCPGLAIGVIAAKYVLDHGNDFSVDEELVAIVENDNCSVDGLQALLGITFGKGNLLYKDYGKNSFTIFNRTQNKAVRLSLKGDFFSGKESSREEMTAFLLELNPEDLFEIQKTDIPPPGYAQIRNSIICYNCGEATMDTRIKELDGVPLCLSCYEQEEGYE